MLLIVSVTVNVILIVGGILSYFKIPDMFLEHYKAYLADINQQKEQEFQQNLQNIIAENEHNFKIKEELLKEKRTILPKIYKKLLELHGSAKNSYDIHDEIVNSKMMEINNYMEENRLFIDKNLFEKIKTFQTTILLLRAANDTARRTDANHPSFKKIQNRPFEIEEEIIKEFLKIQDLFYDAMYK
ncbi:hypothetical protein G9401_02425 [Weissella paramesenteroides]|uniref:hypothetical protein n=1 Tax=Weissella paramesenteroides TaxID=1249 RepID=UPI0023F6625A|nr:hypothetical protein [Weissella paramesenteroides]MDF8367450.1 hypothetical protein [Weissella paramesenteroides]MDF8374448.1 hypothetical protein [Weissella paramesenteroides]